MTDFDEKELETISAFSGLGNHTSCLSHTLQLVVILFTGQKHFSKLIGKVKAVVKKFNKSSKATEKLRYLCNKKLVSNCPTRWNSLYLVIDRLLNVKTSLISVMEELEWDGLSGKRWKIFRSF